MSEPRVVLELRCWLCGGWSPHERWSPGGDPPGRVWACPGCGRCTRSDAVYLTALAAFQAEKRPYHVRPREVPARAAYYRCTSCERLSPAGEFRWRSNDEGRCPKCGHLVQRDLCVGHDDDTGERPQLTRPLVLSELRRAAEAVYGRERADELMRALERAKGDT